jgi:hypothetical protein
MSLNVELLESSLAQIKERETEFSAHFYTNLFADYPIVMLDGAEYPVEILNPAV